MSPFDRLFVYVTGWKLLLGALQLAAAAAAAVSEGIKQFNTPSRLNSGFYTYRTVVTICTTSLTFSSLRSAHTLYLCVLCGSQNKQPLFPYTT